MYIVKFILYTHLVFFFFLSIGQLYNYMCYIFNIFAYILLIPNSLLINLFQLIKIILFINYCNSKFNVL